MVTAIPKGYPFEVSIPVALPDGARLVGATTRPTQTWPAADIWAMGSVGLERRAA